MIGVYRAQEVMNTYAMSEAKYIVGMAITISSGIQVFGLFILIGLHEEVMLAVTVAAGITALLCGFLTLIAMQLASDMGVLSKRLLHATSSNRQQLTSMQRKTVRALRPVYVLAGSFVRIKRHTFVGVFSEVVLNNVVDLLIVSRSGQR